METKNGWNVRPGQAQGPKPGVPTIGASRAQSPYAKSPASLQGQSAYAKTPAKVGAAPMLKTPTPAPKPMASVKPKPSGATVGMSADGNWQTSAKAGKVLGTRNAFQMKPGVPTGKFPGKK